MSHAYTHHFDTPVYKGEVTINTGLFINNEFVRPAKEATIDVVNPSNGQVITKVAIAGAADVDSAVDAAEEAYRTTWGANVTGEQRAKLMNKLADLYEENMDKLAALESLNCGKPFGLAKAFDVGGSVSVLRYYAGLAQNIHGQTNEMTPHKFTFTTREPYGVCGQIIPWNFPMNMMSWKIAPALATSNTIVLKTSEVTPLSALFIGDLVRQAGFPPGVLNIITGYGNVVGQAISEHPRIRKVAFTGSTIVGRKVMEAAAKSNLKKVTLELGGKGPSIIFDDADIDKAVKWALMGVMFNMGQICAAGSRVLIQEGIYDKFVTAYTAAAKGYAQGSGDAFAEQVSHGPQVSEVQFNRIMSYIESGKNDGATVLVGGDRIGTKGFFVHPTLFADTTPDMKIVKEEIFGPVAVLVKFKDEQDAIRIANDTEYGLSAAIFTENVTRSIRVSRALEAGTIWVNLAGVPDHQVTFGGYKQSGMGRELGEYAIETYTQVKGVHINLAMDL